jgi:hypothetical protein
LLRCVLVVVRWNDTAMANGDAMGDGSLFLLLLMADTFDGTKMARIFLVLRLIRKLVLCKNFSNIKKAFWRLKVHEFLLVMHSYF